LRRFLEQVIPGAWTAVLVLLDSAGIWNLHEENLDSWYLGQDLHISVVNLEEDRSGKMVLPFTKAAIFCCMLLSLQKVYMLLFLCCCLVRRNGRWMRMRVTWQ
jgi:hypothetical protein